MARLVIELNCTPEEYYREVEIASALILFVARITSWGTVRPGQPIDLVDHRGRCVGVALLDTQEE